MDNKNNEGKTFGDIFSNINKDSDVSKSISFDDIKEVSNKTKELKSEDLFKSISDTNDGKKATFNSIFSANDLKGEKSDFIFDSDINDNKNDYDNVDKIENKVTNDDIFAPIFSDIDDQENDKDKLLNTDEVVNDNEKDNFLDNVSENPFFNLDKDSKIDSDKKDLKGESDDNSNPFFKESGINSSSDNDDGINVGNIDTEANDDGVDILDNNPFFDSEQFNASDKSNKVDSNDIEKVKSVSKGSDKEGSPFFEDDGKDNIGVNPFFGSKINLIEDSQYDDNNVSNKIDTTNVQNFNVKVVKKKEPIGKFILGVLSYAIFIWLLLIGITLLLYVLDIKIRAAKGDTSLPKYNAFVVLTGSMLPEIQVYDVVVTKKVSAKSLKEGDVITFASSDTRFLNTIITHRIIKKNYDSKTGGYTFQTQGDNNNVADSALVQPNNIYGKVILKIPKLGYLQEFLATDGGWILVILLPCLIVISYDIVKLSKGLKKKKYKNIKVQSR